MADPHDELTAAELEALAQLPGREEPPAWLEENIVSDLRRMGFIATARPRTGRMLAGAAAASVILFAAGLLVGASLPAGSLRATAPPSQATTTPGGRQFVLFLYEDETYETPSAAGAAERVEEYRRWGQALARGGHLVDGVKLKDGGEVMPSGEAVPGDGLGLLAGYFILVAGDRREALQLAADCPHLKYHGRIVVREVDPV